jgi:hypothetical protein
MPLDCVIPDKITITDAPLKTVLMGFNIGELSAIMAFVKFGRIVAN